MIFPFKEFGVNSPYVSMRIPLVKPPQARRAVFHIMPPLGLGYLASALKKAGFQPTIIDCLEKNLTINGLLHIIQAYHPDLVGFTGP